MLSIALFTTLALAGLKTLTMANPLPQRITPNLNVPDGYQTGFATVSPCLRFLFPTSLARPGPRFLKLSSPVLPFTARLGTFRPTERLHNRRWRLQRPDSSLSEYRWTGPAACWRLCSGHGWSWPHRLYSLRDVL